MGVDEAKDRCAYTQFCQGFSFQGTVTTGNSSAPVTERVKVYYKTKWDNIPNNIHNSGWNSYHREQVDAVATSNVLAFLVAGFLALSAAGLLYLMVSGHVSIATRNVTTIETSYGNMANPYDQGSTVTNLEQIFGRMGVDWLLPVLPCNPVTD